MAAIVGSDARFVVAPACRHQLDFVTVSRFIVCP
jgi:hypothetical protein